MRILFVCYGNICRSPMAEVILRDRLRRTSLEQQVFVDSAGTHARPGQPPLAETQAVLDAAGLSGRSLRSRRVTAADLLDFDLVLAMDDENRRDLEALGPSRRPIQRMLEYRPGPSWLDVPDPYIVGGFEDVFHLLEEACEGLLAAVQQELDSRP